MEFIRLPQKWNNLRTDCCTYLKDEDGEAVKLKMKMKSISIRKLQIRILLKTINGHPHFLKLFRLDSKPHREEESRSTEFTINKNEDVIELNFFGIRKCTKDQAIKYIKESLNQIEDYEKIFKENSSVIILEIKLSDSLNNTQLDQLLHEIHVGKNVSESMEVLSYTPKTIYDGEITFVMKDKIKDECSICIELKDFQKKYTNISKPAKNVLVFSIPKIDFGSDISEFSAQLFCEENVSNKMFFKVRRSDHETLKRKLSFNNGREECPDNKICRSLSDSTFELKTVDICADRKSLVNNFLTTKIYREIARVGHDFAFGKEMNERMSYLLETLPVVCILQDDIGDTPLNNAILKDNEDRANKLVDIIQKNFPQEINLKNTSGHTALILASACNVSQDFIKKLIKCGADLMTTDCDENTAFHIAIQYHKGDVLQLLINEAFSQNLLNENSDILISLLKEAIDSKFDYGIQILADKSELIRNVTNFETVLDSDRLIFYKKFMEGYIYMNMEEITPIMENLMNYLMDSFDSPDSNSN